MGIKVHTSESNGYSPGSYYREGAPAQLDVNSEESISKWCEILNLSRKDLLAAAEAYGPVIKNIRRGLRQSEEDAA